MLASIKILPEEANINLTNLTEKIENSLPTDVRMYKTEEEPIAFGLVSLIIHLIIPEDNPQIMEQVEESLKLNKGISEIQVIGMTRLG